MALGTDTIFANAVLDLKKEGMDIRLVAVVPCANQDKKWSKKDQKRYQEILQAADEVVQLSEEEYRPELMRIRNRWLVDHAEMLIAVWDGRQQWNIQLCSLCHTKNSGISDLSIILL